jgi:type II secretory pathway component GspD/PulD (secretin)
MKLNHAFAFFFATGTVFAAASFSPAVQAQTTGPQDRAAPQALAIQRLIPVTNLSPDLLAYWLDPAHNEAPIARQNLRPSATKNAGKPENSIELPTGVRSVRPITPQNKLLVVGTEAGIHSLQTIITNLDRPLKQVEIETHFVTLSDESLKAFGVEFGEPQAGQVSINFVRGNFQSTLNKLLTENKAKLISAPRITANDNMEAKLESRSTRPISIDLTETKRQVNLVPALTSLPSAAIVYLNSGYELYTTPTINRDDTMMISLALKQVLRLGDDSQFIDLLPAQNANTTANVRDGDTIVLKVAESKPAAGQIKGSKSAPQNMVVFVTPRIIRRAGDDNIKS